MKLRRALTAAAATAVLAPTALLAAPAAFATDEPGTTPSAEAPTEPGDGDTTTDPTTDPSEPTTPAPSGSAGPTEPPTTDEPTAPGPSVDPSHPTDDPTDGTTPPATDEPTDEPTEDPTCEDASDEAAISTTLRGLPSKVVAGSGWHNFTFRASNTSDKAMKSVDAYVMLSAIDKGDFDDVSGLLSVQWYDEDAGAWENVDEYGYFASLADLAPGEYADAKLRLKVDAKTPGSYGFAFAVGAYHDEDDLCGYSEGSEYEFDVLVAGSNPGNVPPATGKPSDHKPGKPAPQGGLKELPVTGKLAETGSSSALPMIAAVAGVTMAVGAGAIFVVRRRKTDGVAA
ncbi:LPXTG cell wall anchor domain-containing protein [Streptomyces niger]|uniref:LPXTG cell wall anchor domain-containing protein n=1 Tax=Streptomyces niger TaxID=66373 RepID=UPI0006996BA5|nr:LPXTG cell wall anchor domain-containing protein [Streptomyces niger]